MSTHTTSTNYTPPRRFSTAGEIINNYRDLAMDTIRKHVPHAERLNMDDVRAIMREAREHGPRALTDEAKRVYDVVRGNIHNMDVNQGVRSVFNDLHLGQRFDSLKSSTMGAARVALREISDSHGARLTQVFERIASSEAVHFAENLGARVIGNAFKGTAGKATLGAAAVGVAAISGTASASEVRRNGGTAHEGREVGAYRGVMEGASTFDPSFGIASGTLSAVKDTSLSYRQGHGSGGAFSRFVDRVTNVNLSQAITKAILRPTLAMPDVIMAGVNYMNGRETRITLNGIDRQQEQLFNTSSSFPQKISIHGHDVDTHIALRDPARFNAFRNYYATHNTNGQFNDELQTLNRFTQLEQQRDTILSRSEARGDLSHQAAQQLQNGTSAQSIRSGMTFQP